MTNQTARVLELLKRFNDGKKVCIEALGNEVLWEGKSEKTIRRDLDVQPLAHIPGVAGKGRGKQRSR